MVLSFDLDAEKLKLYYSKTSTQGAYAVIKRYLLKNGFEHRKDSDYVNQDIMCTSKSRHFITFYR